MKDRFKRGNCLGTTTMAESELIVAAKIPDVAARDFSHDARNGIKVFV